MTQLTTTEKELRVDFLSRPLLATLNIDWEKAIYITFILLAIITRFWGLGSRVMSHDESLHTQYSYQFYDGQGYNHTPLMHGPFLFHATAVSYWLFGDSDLSARIPVAILGVLLVTIPYLLRGWLGKIGALFASFFFLISPYITYYSRYIRHDIYIIVWALIVFIAAWYYLHDRREKYLWWFAAGTALMFATKEVAFIYVAIFGSFLVIRLLPQVIAAPWLRNVSSRLRIPILVAIAGLLIVGVGLVGIQRQTQEAETTATTEATEGFAADPTEDLETEAVAETTSSTALLLRWAQIAGIGLFGLGLFLLARAMRPHIDNYPEFDLIILFSTLILPAVSPFLTTLAGWDPLDYTISNCVLAGQENMTTLQIFLARLGNSTCWTTLLQSGMVRSGGFLVLLLIVSILVGLWWHNQRWIVAAVIFHTIFAVLYTSVFTNPGGWASGMIGSLGYWLDQQEVQRGSQPLFYYFFVVPFYEFLPLIFSLLAVRLWAKIQGFHKAVGYWLTAILLALLAFSLTNWLYNRPLQQLGVEPRNWPGALVALVLLGGGLLYWYFVRARRLILEHNASQLQTFLAHHAGEEELRAISNKLDVDYEALAGNQPAAKASSLVTELVAEDRLTELVREVNRKQSKSGRQAQFTWQQSLWGLFQRDAICGIVPFATWWLILTWAAYTFAGEKMPWLSTHFVIPMALLAGWYFNEKLKIFDARTLLSRRSLTLLALTMVLIVAIFLALGPPLLGQIQLGNQQVDNLSGIGRFLGSLIIVGILVYLWQQVSAGLSRRLRNTLVILGIFGVLSLLTIRFTYMANFPNADYTTEFMVYAHGAPATKEVVLEQVEELSMRLHGDKGIRVAYDNDVSWPFTWYLRDYPNRLYFGENPSNNLRESPVVIVGGNNWSAVEPFLGDEYEQHTYTFLWWPMERYRDITWNAIFGNPYAENARGLGDPNVRQALWDIFFYRDYEKYGQVFNQDYSPGAWPLRHDLRLYIRKDVLATLWDHGVGAVSAEGLEEAYAENELTLSPVLAINADGTPGAAEGQLFLPRNVAVGPDDRIYVLDSGNYRVQVFDENGEFVNAWGSIGTGPGQFNQDPPWGLAVDDSYVYVADTWNHRIQKFTLDGEFVEAYGRNGLPSVEDEGGGLGLFYGPRGLALLGDDRLLVTDTGNHRLQIMSRSGEFLGDLGGPGADLGRMNEPVGVTTDEMGNIYLADTWNGRIQKFSPTFVPLAEWRVDAWTGQSTVNKPYIAVDSAGRIYVTDPEAYRVLIFDANGQYLARFGSYGTEPGNFALPNGIAIDAQDNIYIADADNNRILKFAAIFGAPVTAPDDLLDEESLPQEEEQPAQEEQPAREESEGGEEEAIEESEAQQTEQQQEEEPAAVEEESPTP